VLAIVDVGADTTKKVSIAALLQNASSGTAAAPGIAFDGDNTGIYRPGADQLAISTNGTQKLCITSDGKLGLGTSTPNVTLGIIGTTNQTFTNNPYNVEISDDRAFAAGVGGGISFRAKYNTAGSYSNIGFISGIKENATDGNYAGALVLGTRTNGSGGGSMERVRITSTGNVGIGTTSPDSRFEVLDDSATGIISRSTNTQSTNTNKALKVRNNSDTDTFNVSYKGQGYFADSVGIGTTSPSSVLDIRNTSPVMRLWHTDVTNAYTQIVNVNGNTYIGSRNDTNDGILLFGGYGGGTFTEYSRQDSTQHSFKISGTEAARIDSSGRLLVGTSSAYFAAESAITAPLMQTHGTNANLAQVLIGSWASGNNVGGSITLARSESGTIGDFGSALSSASDVLGNVRFNGSDGTKFVEGAKIYAVVDGTWGTDDAPTRLVFSTTADGASSPTERMRISSNGRVNFNTAGQNPSATVEGVQINEAGYIFCSTDGNSSGFFNRNTSDGTVVGFRRSNVTVGSVSVTTTATSYNTSSDYRLKENVVPLTGAADRLNQLQVHRFNFIADPATTVDGFLAHEAQAIVPECVTGTKDEVDDDGNPVYQGIDQSKMVPLLTAALQEALAKIETLEQRLSDAGIA